MILFKHCLRILSFFALILTLGLVVAPAAAQLPCTPRTDWLPYRVTSGDTLGRIATRFSTVVSTLAAGNCLSNINLIFLGQVLKVPPRPVDTPIESISGREVTFQQFERGFMTWEYTGQIRVYFGQSGGQVRLLRLDQYATLPDNPVTSVPPGGRFKPEFGFGKVWGNIPGIRAALGWATTRESGQVLDSSPTDSDTYYLMLPDGRAITIVNNNLWSIYTGVFPGATRRTTVTATFQPFEGGFLLWRQDTGRIDEFHADNQYAGGYNLDQYANLSDTPIPDVPPAGLFKPVLGLGRVWTHFITTRDALGWGLLAENTYQATFVTDLGTFVQCVNLPHGVFVSYPIFDGARSYTWEVVADCG